MNKFKQGMAVIVIGEQNEIKKGTIKEVYEGLGYAIVEMPNGELEKVEFKDLGILPETEAVETERPEEPKAEPIKDDSENGAKVITKTQFMDKVQYVTSPEYLLDERKIDANPISVMIKSMSVLIVGSNISEKLFGDKEEIEITKNELKNVIKENCSPMEIVKSVNNKMSIVDVFPISMLSACLLIEVVRMLFEDNGEND